MPIHRLRDAIAARPGRAILAVVLVLTVVHFAGIFVRGVRPRVVRGDGVHYYVYLRSMAFDRDLSFENDYRALYGLDFGSAGLPPGTDLDLQRTPTGLVRNYMAVGTPLFWSPLFAGVAAGAHALAAAGVGAPPDGFALAFQLVPDLGGLVAAGLALWFTFLFCREASGGRAALAAVLSLLAGSSLLYYTLIAPSYSHAVSAMAVSAYFLVWWRTRDSDSVRRFAVMGILGGLVALVRWQDAVLLGTLAVDAAALASRRPGPWTRRGAWALGRLSLAALAALVAFVPQLAAWTVLYGRPLLIPQGGEFMRWTSPHLVDVLVSPFRGLIAWTPLVALGVAGLVPLWRTHARLAVAAALFLGASLYVNAAVADWWAGEAFGARRFLSCFPVFAVGLAAWLQRTRRPRAAGALIAVLVASNLLLLLHYELFMLGYRDLAPYPDSWQALWVERFFVPFRLLGRVF